MLEIFKDIFDYKGYYQVSNLGNVKSLERTVLMRGKYPFTKKGRILKSNPDSKGYLQVILCKNSKQKSFKVSVLVAIAFLNHKPDGTMKIVVDHKNNIKTDDRKGNLQLISNRENGSKDKFRKNPSSMYTGVCWDKLTRKWRAQIYLSGKSKHLGSFKTEIEASNAYQKTLKQII